MFLVTAKDLLIRRVGMAHIPSVCANLESRTWAMPTLQDAKQLLFLSKKGLKPFKYGR